MVVVHWSQNKYDNMNRRTLVFHAQGAMANIRLRTIAMICSFLKYCRK